MVSGSNLRYVIYTLLCWCFTLGVVFGLDVTWYPVYEGISHFVYNISVAGSGNVSVDVVFSNTSFDISSIRNIHFYRLDNFTEVRDVPVFTSRRYAYFIRDNATGKLTKKFRTKLVQNGTRQEVRIKKRWNLLSPGSSHLSSKKLKRSYGIHSLNPGAVVWYRLEFDVPVEKLSAGWGSTGKVALELNGIEYHPWWNSSWSRRRAILVSNSGGYLDHYQLLINLSKYLEMSSDCSDIRFVDDDNTTELPYWVESCTSSYVAVWVRVPEIPANGNKTIYLYYSNPSARSNSNASAVFELFDDLEDGALLEYSLSDAGWSASTNKAHSGSYSIYHTDTATTETAKRSVTYYDDFYLEAWVLTTANVDDPLSIALYSGSAMVFRVWHSVGNQQLAFIDSAGTIHRVATSSAISANKFYKIVMKRYNGQITAELYDSDGKTLLASYSMTDTATYDTLAWTSWRGGYGDDLIFRKYTDPEPTYTVLQEEIANITLRNASFTPFPNPGEKANFSIHVENPMSESTTVTLTVLDEQNNTVATNSTTLPTGYGNVSLSVTLITSGRYYFYWHAQSASRSARYPEQGYEVGPKVLAPAFTRKFSIPEGVSLLAATVVWQGSTNSSGAVLELISPEQILIDRDSDYSGKSFRSRLSMDVYSLPGFAYNITSYYGIERLSISSPVAGEWVLRVVDTNLSYFQVDWDVR